MGLSGITSFYYLFPALWPFYSLRLRILPKNFIDRKLTFQRPLSAVEPFDNALTDRGVVRFVLLPFGSVEGWTTAHNLVTTQSAFGRSNLYGIRVSRTLVFKRMPSAVTAPGKFLLTVTRVSHFSPEDSCPKCCLNRFPGLRMCISKVALRFLVRLTYLLSRCMPCLRG